MACEVPEPSKASDRIRDVIHAMTDSFATYLMPHNTLLNKLSSMDSVKKQEILTKALYDSKDAMRDLLEWLDDEDDSTFSQMEFYEVLRLRGDDEDFLPWDLISPEGQDKWRSVTDMARLFVDLIDGNKFEIVTSETLNQVMDILKKKKIIQPKGGNKDILKMMPLDAFMEILKSVKRNKPDWPFFVWDTLEELHPSHFKSGGLQCENPSRFDSDLHMENPSAMSSSSGLQTENPSTATSYSGLQTENPSTATSYSGLHTENPSTCNTESANSSAVASENKFYRKPQMPKRKDQVEVTTEELEILEKFIGVGALHRSAVTVNENPCDIRKGWKANFQMPDYSDDDTDDEETELKQSAEGIPDLNLRDYQKELAKEALEGKNTIICAPTGSGKTRVATHIIIKHLEKGSENNPKKVCFFARTVPLAVQQNKSISKYLPEKYKAFLLTGDSPYSTALKAFIPEHDIIILTPMILQNHFNRGLLKDLTEFTLLVFDECHHAREKEPYNTLMLSYLKLKFDRSPSSSPLPQVLGLTASFPAEKAKSQSDTTDSVLQVCANLAADEISTVEVHKDELARTVPAPIEEIDLLQERHEDASVAKIISVMVKLENEAQHYGSEISSEEVKDLLSVGKIPSDRKSQQYNQWTSKLKNAAEKIEMTPKETLMPARNLMIIADYLKHYNVALEAHDLVHLEDVLLYLNACFKSFEENERNAARETKFFNYFRDLKKAMASFRHEENPNLRKLEKVIKKYLVKKGEDSRGIVFVKTRALAEALASWLNRCGQDAIVKLNATIFTGTNAPESEGGMTQAQQDACVESFRKGEVRLLIATSVAEEGIDVPECNLVIKYNHVGNEISTIQTKGRSRKQGGRSILLALPSIRDRELVNRFRAKMMFESVNIIRHMDAAERSNKIENLQRKALKKLELDELLKDHEREELKDAKFTMYCKKCRKTSVDSDFVKTIFGTHRVVTNWNIWEYSNIRGIRIKFVDDLKLIGSVRCRASVEKNATCNGPLGTFLVYSGIGFLALGIKNFVLVEENDTKLKPYSRWKDVKYEIDEIEIQDIKRYIEDSRSHQSSLKRNSTKIVGSISTANSTKENTSETTLDNVQSEFSERTVMLSGKMDQEDSGIEAIQDKKDNGIEAMQDKKDSGIDAMQDKKDSGIDAMQGRKDNGIEALQDRKDNGVEAMQDRKDNGIEAKQDRKVTDVNIGTDPPSDSFGSCPFDLQSQHKLSFAFSELSTFQDNDDHHQTKKTSIRTATKHMPNFLTPEQRAGDHVCEEENPQKCLDDAPVLSENFDDFKS